MDHAGLSGQTHGRKTVILCDHNISGLHPVCNGVIHTVGAFVYNQRFNVRLPEFVGSITQNQTGYFIFPAESHRDIHHRTSVGINQYTHDNASFRK